MIMRPPQAPRPIREMFHSDEAFKRAIQAHEAESRSRREAQKMETAVMIVGAICIAGMAVWLMGFVLLIQFGWRGPVGAVLLVGLLFVATEQVRRRL